MHLACCTERTFDMNFPASTRPWRLLLAVALAAALLASARAHLTEIRNDRAADETAERALPQSQQAATTETATTGAPESKAPSLIDFSTYTALFNRKYSTWKQTLVRQKLFTVKQLQVFLTAAKYRLNNLGYYMVINQYSDLTPEEERLKMSGDGGELPSDDEADDDLMDDEQAERLLLAELDDQAKGGAPSNYDRRRPDARRLAAAAAKRHQLLQRQQQQRRRRQEAHERPKRSVDSARGFPLERLSLADLVRVPGHSTSTQSDHLNIRWVVPSSNPDYMPMESLTFGEAPAARDERRADVPEDQIERIYAAASSWLAAPVPKMVSFLSDSAKSSFSWLASKSLSWSRHRAPSDADLEEEVEDEEQQQQQQQPRKADLQQADVRVAQPGADMVVKDWRDSGCIAPPIQQGDCQSCYAVSSNAFLEWAFCMNQDRVLTPLSAQYLISCGPQFKREADPELKIEFYGCNRGRSRQAMHFVKNYGAELEANMPYLGRDTPCPIEPGTPLKSKGYIRPNVRQHVRMAANTKQLELALKVGPVIVNFREPVDFMAYGGGMVGTCHQRGGHAMLVVGHGVENNRPYLIVKNSFGTDWGMGGYFKFDRQYTTDCVKDFVLPRVSFPSRKSQARHVKAYLAGRESTTGQKERESVLLNLDKIFDVGAGGLLSS